ncbi:MAG TPA: EAL domain-containing protein, partial [Campylobacterales bacterium]|nr:EAL domain-containing protein [Campylobacterales bacterium]
ETDFKDIETSVQKLFSIIVVDYYKFFVLILILAVISIYIFIIRPTDIYLEKAKEIIKIYRKRLKRFNRKLQEYKTAIDTSSLVSKTDPEGNITYVNQSFCDVSGYSREELIGKSHNIVRHPDVPKEVFRELWETITSKRIWKGVIRNIRKDGREYYMNTTIIPILHEDNKNIKEFLSIRSDVTEIMRHRSQMVRQNIDEVTKLPNRQKLLIDLNEKISNNSKLAIIKIDNLKEIKDFYGMNVINRIILNIVEIFKNILSQHGVTLYRIDNFEFALFQNSNFENDFLIKIENLIRYFDHNILRIDDMDFSISITIGISRGDIRNIIFNAEFALQQAIEQNRDLVVLDSIDEIEQDFRKNIEMTNKLKKAITEGNIVIFGQEIVPNFEELPYKKYEVLIRMVDGEKVISPFFFLNIAKKARLYPTLTKIVIRKSFAYFQDREDEFSINLNMEDILNSEILETLREEIISNRMGHRVILELVESEKIENFDTVNRFIQDFKSLGCRIAVDDFGTGYSNFEYLMKMDIDVIKIDGSLIKNIDKDVNAQLVVKLIADFAKSKGIQTVGEFVDRESVLQKLKELGIDYSQGFYLAKPEKLI